MKSAKRHVDYVARALIPAIAAIGCSEDNASHLGIQASAAPVRGGIVVTRGSRPWQARITVSDSESCSGAIVGPRWILTAGHCVAETNVEAIGVVVGDHSVSEVDASEQWRGVAEVALYPAWGEDDGVLIDNDLALLRLDRGVDITSVVQVVALSETSRPCVASVSGWGDSSYAGAASDELQSVVLGLAPAQTCEAHIAAIDERESASGRICAGSPDGSIGSCHGDSGAPLVEDGPTGPRLVGVAVSGGPACDEYSVFADVLSYGNWIRSMVN
jgi:secreted trypsin-like serine protease